MQKGEKRKPLPRDDSKYKTGFKIKSYPENLSESPEKTKASGSQPYSEVSKRYANENTVVKNKQLINIESILNDYKDHKDLDNI